VPLKICQSSASPHSVNSTLRERIVEHIFVGDVLRRLWQLGITDVEVLRSEFDAGGYDFVSYGKVVRHVQMKTMTETGKAVHVKVSMKLMEKPSGCVIWAVLTQELKLQSYLWFGNDPGKPFPDISKLKIAKHSKGNAKGVKLERPMLRIVPKSKFERFEELDHLLARLFGEPITAVLQTTSLSN
jgi:hypothetical protein